MFGSIMSENQSPVKRILKFPRFELYFQVIWYLEGKIEMFERKYCEWISCFSQFSEVNRIYFIVEGLILLYSIGFTVYLLEFDTCVVGIGVDNWMEFIFGYFWIRMRWGYGFVTRGSVIKLNKYLSTDARKNNGNWSCQLILFISMKERVIIFCDCDKDITKDIRYTTRMFL